MAAAILTAEGGILLPSRIRDTWGLRPGDRVALRLRADGVVEIEPDHREKDVEVSMPLEIENQIEGLYDEIIALTEHPASRPNRNEEIESAYARLRVLQQAEAEQFRKRFEAGLKMPIDAGEKILARARTLRKELEDLASSDAAAEAPDKPQA